MAKDERRLDGRVALVTGAAVRLGRAIAVSLAEAGASVAIHHHLSEKAAATVVAGLRAAGHRAEAFRADLTDDAALDGLLPAVEAALGPVSVLVNSAGRFDSAAFLEIEHFGTSFIGQLRRRSDVTGAKVDG